MSLHDQGKDRQGVSVWTGGWNSIPRWMTNLFACLSIGIGIAVVSLLVFGPHTHESRVATLVLGGESIFFAVLCHWLSNFRNKLESLKGLDELSKEMEMTPETLSEIARANEIKPAMMLNGEARYDPNQLFEMRVLLRPSKRPDTPEELLRAAAETQDSEPNNLLHPTNQPGENADNGN